MFRIRRRTALGLLAGGVSAAALGAELPDGIPDSGTLVRRLPSPVERENRAAGEPWWPTQDPGRDSDDHRRQIQGYASATSVAPGESIDFHVAVDPVGRYRISLHRLGWYGGAGARTVLTSPEFDGAPQPVPPADPTTGTIACRWPVSWTVRIPDDWTSGLYQAVFTSADGWRACTPFVVRDDRRAAAIAVVLPVTTWQAYNQWPMDRQHGRSLYNGYSETGRQTPDTRAMEVSYDRPYAGDGIPTHLARDHDAIQWLERNHYDVSYATSLDLHSGRLDPTRHAGIVFAGHDEYWSVQMRRAAERAVAASGSLAFFGANSSYWHIRVRSAADGRPERVVACAKSADDPGLDADGPTIRWREIGRPEQAMIGVQYNGIVDGRQPLVVRSAEHWFWAGTGVADGDRIPGVVCGEADGLDPTAPRPAASTATVLSASPYRTRYGRRQVQNTHLYGTPEGGLVFASGTLCWTAALNQPGYRDERIERATANLLDRITGRTRPVADTPARG
ncbi:hypothetical protein MRQ36_13765 [Micromonospora sp. R77]|uniref:N,N-dimethylformamidase beta subunit family domain-containing protein n=1 Tax=Micromonospora sp. R77 TaxID=2925836 RepID=UPI001F620031|nr:N,N-dimethylformamidase beta subunit family domain-containing protein [Micromonospora sp. R77]MCI4063593.1 hypothetical protein [Micromonospora sp. R77]